MTGTGELAGVWPVPLGDHGKLDRDLWTQRTFTAVRLVHELDGGGGTTSWVKELAPNRKLMQGVWERLDDPDLKVVRYWDDGPQPISTGDSDLLPIVYYRPGRDALFAVVSYAKEDRDVEVRIDLAALGLPAGTTARGWESEAAIPMPDGTIRFPLRKHDIRMVLLTAP
jgi:hypothetical protein